MTHQLTRFVRRFRTAGVVMNRGFQGSGLCLGEFLFFFPSTLNVYWDKEHSIKEQQENKSGRTGLCVWGWGPLMGSRNQKQTEKERKIP